MRTQSVPANKQPRNPRQSASFRAGLTVLLAAAILHSPSLSWGAPAANTQAGPCFATANEGATVFDSADASAVQDAVDAASAGDTVKVAGTCAGVQLRNGTNQTVFIEKPLTLAGGYTSSNWNVSNPQANPTLLDAQLAGRVILATAAVTVSHLTVQNGKVAGINGSGANFDAEANVQGVTFWKNEGGADGGGAFFSKPATVIDSIFKENKGADGAGGALFLADATLTHTLFISNSAGLGGGAYFAGDNHATLAGVIFQGNSAQRSGGAEFWGTSALSDTLFYANTAVSKAGGAYFNGSAVLTRTTFDRNGSSGDAGGAWFNNTAMLVDTTFNSNEAKIRSGGAWFVVDGAITGGAFISNTASSAGGAYFAAAGVVSGTTFTGNEATGIDGGGAYFAGKGTVRNSTFSMNKAGDLAAGAYFNGEADLAGVTFQKNASVESGAGAVFLGPAMLTETQFIDNTTGDNNLGGGGFFLDAVSMVRVVFLGNSAGRGGGAHIREANANVRIVNSLFAGNIAVTGVGNQLYLFEPGYNGGTADILFTTIAAPALTAGSALYTNKGTVNLTNTIITSHTIGIEQIDTAEVNEANMLFFGNTANTAGTVNSGGGTVNADPAFRDPAGSNYRLQLGSPAIDAGVDLGVNSDLDTAPRPIFAGFDIGAYERGIVPAGLIVTATTSAPPLQPVTLLTATISAGTEPLVYTWDLGDDSPVVTGAVISHVYPAGVYTATVTVSNPNGAISDTVQIPVPYRLLASIVVREAPLPLVLQRRQQE